MWIYHILFIHSLVNGHLNYFQFLPIFNNLTLKIYEQVLCGDVFHSLGYKLSNGVVGSCGHSVFNS